MKTLEKKYQTNTQPVVRRIYSLLGMLRHADIRDVETMEAFFVEFDASYKPGMSDRQRLCELVLHLQARMQIRAPLISSSLALSHAELLTASSLERALLASLVYLNFSFDRKVGISLLSRGPNTCKSNEDPLLCCEPAPFAR